MMNLEFQQALKKVFESPIVNIDNKSNLNSEKIGVQTFSKNVLQYIQESLEKSQTTRKAISKTHLLLSEMMLISSRFSIPEYDSLGRRSLENIHITLSVDESSIYIYYSDRWINIQQEKLEEIRNQFQKLSQSNKDELKQFYRDRIRNPTKNRKTIPISFLDLFRWAYQSTWYNVNFEKKQIELIFRVDRNLVSTPKRIKK